MLIADTLHINIISSYTATAEVKWRTACHASPIYPSIYATYSKPLVILTPVRGGTSRVCESSVLFPNANNEYSGSRSMCWTLGLFTVNSSKCFLQISAVKSKVLENVQRCASPLSALLNRMGWTLIKLVWLSAVSISGHKVKQRGNSIISSYKLCNSNHCMRIMGHLEKSSHAQHSLFSSSSIFHSRGTRSQTLRLLIVCFPKAALSSVLSCSRKPLLYF